MDRDGRGSRRTGCLITSSLLLVGLLVPATAALLLPGTSLESLVYPGAVRLPLGSGAVSIWETADSPALVGAWYAARLPGSAPTRAGGPNVQGNTDASVAVPLIGFARTLRIGRQIFYRAYRVPQSLHTRINLFCVPACDTLVPLRVGR